MQLLHSAVCMKAFGEQHLVFHVDLDNFFGQVELKKDPRWVEPARQAHTGSQASADLVPVTAFRARPLLCNSTRTS